MDKKEKYILFTFIVIDEQAPNMISPPIKCAFCSVEVISRCVVVVCCLLQ